MIINYADNRGGESNNILTYSLNFKLINQYDFN
jgi:hypothetical protein